MEHTLDDVATGDNGTPRLRIVGRPAQGTDESHVILEEPGEPVLMHWRDKLRPHYRRNCPHCTGSTEEVLKVLHYVGAITLSRELVILELSQRCFDEAHDAAENIGAKEVGPGLDAAAQPLEVPIRFRGLLVRISRASFARSPRVLYCNQRVKVTREWTFSTREELARIWGVPIKPRLYRADEA